MANYKLTIGHLYKTQMCTYGDNGNVIALKKRCEWRGIEVKVKEIGFNYKIKPGEFDLYFFGGGQDQVQSQVSEDLVLNHKGKELEKDLERGVPLLSICGGYQLLGDYYKPQKGPKLTGLGFFPAYTIGSGTRMIGNLIIDSRFGQLVGFENHSGKTFLEEGGQALGKVTAGFGNNGEDKLEGCIKNNAVGCYMHGSLLPKNPELADWLIKQALEVKYGKKVKLSALNDKLENKAHQAAIEKFS